MTDWDPALYRRFSSERFAPFDDLLALVAPRPGLRAVDLGCGTGELTVRLHERLGDGDVVGIDTSAAMLGRARELDRPGLRFEADAIETLAGSYDLIFSNAALQWCDDHAALIARLFGALEPCGQLVAQFPAQRRPAPYDLIVEVANEEPARTALRGWVQPWAVLALEDYAELLHGLGATEIVAFDKLYPHVLADADGIVDWQRGTVLTAYRERLDPAAFAAFERRLRERVRERWPQRPVFFPFRRTFIAARKPA
jgi:trans-aconitate 2-methyltransferase